MKWLRTIIRLLIRVDGFFYERRIILAFLDYCVVRFGEFSGQILCRFKKKKKKGGTAFYFLTFPKGGL